MSPQPTDADVRLVLGLFGIGSASSEPLANAGGFSGARIWRVHTAVGDYCLKRWPAVSPERHGRIAGLVRYARDVGLNFIAVPMAAGGRPHVELGGALWDLSEWMPGRADFAEDPSVARLHAAAAALARLHRAWQRFAERPRPCPAVARRLAAAADWIELVRGGFRPSGQETDPVTHWADRAWQIVVRQVPEMMQTLAPWTDSVVAVQPCLCDIWHDHILFTGERVTGLIDYGAVKPDNVAADLARMLGSLVGDNHALVETALDAYAAIRPLHECERQLVPILDRTGVVLGLANWLRWLYRDGRTFADRTAVVRRLSELVLRAERHESVGRQADVVDS